MIGYRVLFLVAAFIIVGVTVMPKNAVAWIFDTHAEFSQKYDDNVTFVKENTVEDLISALTLGLSAERENKRSEWKVKGALTQEFFADNRDFNNLSQQAEIEYKRGLTKHDVLMVSNRFTHADEPRSFEDAVGRAVGRYDYFLNRYDMQQVHQFNERLSSIVQFNNEFYDPARSDLPRSILNKGLVQADYAVGSKTSLLGAYAYGVREFDFGNQIIAHNPELGLRRELAPKLSLETRVGSSMISYHNESVTKPRYLALLTLMDEERFDWKLLFLKEIGHNAFSEDPFDIWQISLNAARQISRRLRGEWNAFYGSGNFLVSGDEQDFIGSSVSASFELKEDMLARAGYAFSKTDSNDSTSEYSKNTIFINLMLEF
jgi:hypothetical protein